MESASRHCQAPCGVVGVASSSRLATLGMLTAQERAQRAVHIKLPPKTEEARMSPRRAGAPGPAPMGQPAQPRPPHIRARPSSRWREGFLVNDEGWPVSGGQSPTPVAGVSEPTNDDYFRPWQERPDHQPVWWYQPGGVLDAPRDFAGGRASADAVSREKAALRFAPEPAGRRTRATASPERASAARALEYVDEPPERRQQPSGGAHARSPRAGCLFHPPAEGYGGGGGVGGAAAYAQYEEAPARPHARGPAATPPRGVGAPQRHAATSADLFYREMEMDLGAGGFGGAEAHDGGGGAAHAWQQEMTSRGCQYDPDEASAAGAHDREPAARGSRAPRGGAPGRAAQAPRSAGRAARSAAEADELDGSADGAQEGGATAAAVVSRERTARGSGARTARGTSRVADRPRAAEAGVGSGAGGAGGRARTPPARARDARLPVDGREARGQYFPRKPQRQPPRAEPAVPVQERLTAASARRIWETAQVAAARELGRPLPSPRPQSAGAQPTPNGGRPGRAAAAARGTAWASPRTHARLSSGVIGRGARPSHIQHVDSAAAAEERRRREARHRVAELQARNGAGADGSFGVHSPHSRPLPERRRHAHFNQQVTHSVVGVDASVPQRPPPRSSTSEHGAPPPEPTPVEIADDLLQGYAAGAPRGMRTCGLPRARVAHARARRPSAPPPPPAIHPRRPRHRATPRHALCAGHSPPCMTRTPWRRRRSGTARARRASSSPRTRRPRRSPGRIRTRAMDAVWPRMAAVAAVATGVPGRPHSRPSLSPRPARAPVAAAAQPAVVPRARSPPRPILPRHTAARRRRSRTRSARAARMRVLTG